MIQATAALLWAYKCRKLCEQVGRTSQKDKFTGEDLQRGDSLNLLLQISGVNHPFFRNFHVGDPKIWRERVS